MDMRGNFSEKMSEAAKKSKSKSNGKSTSRRGAPPSGPGQQANTRRASSGFGPVKFFIKTAHLLKKKGRAIAIKTTWTPMFGFGLS